MEINKSTNFSQDKSQLSQTEALNEKPLLKEDSYDEFIGHSKSSYENNDNLKFKNVKIKFYPEDAKKIKEMGFEEANIYRNMLLQAGKYTIVKPEDSF